MKKYNRETSNHIRGKRRRKQRDHRICIGAIGSLILVLLFICIFSTAGAVEREAAPVIQMKPTDMKMLQDDQIPAPKIEVTMEGETSDQLLNEAEKYDIRDLEQDLKAGKGYEVLCDTDGTKEGSYPIQIKLSKELKAALEGKWQGKVAIRVEQGTLNVQNKIGKWEGDRFKKYDGSYVKNEFITSKGYRYYLDEDGKRVNGKKKIGLKNCEFDKKGRLVSAENDIDPNKPMLALTFDDGPGPRTPELLEKLKEYNAHATFFMLGGNAKRYPDIVKKILESESELGNHSYNHANLTKLDEEGIKNEIDSTNEAIVQGGGQPAKLVRPPYGALNAMVKEQVQMPVIMWSLDTMDWKTKDTKKTYDTVLNEAKDGDIILMHDIHSSSIDAALQLIPKLTEKGFQLVTISEMAQARGIPLENGVKYFRFPK